MGWRRHTGAVVSMVLLASVVGHYVLHRQFESRFHRLLVAANGDAQFGAGPLLLPPLGDDAPSGVPRILDVTERPRRLEPILPALQIRDEVTEEGPSTRERLQPVPVPQDATPPGESPDPVDDAAGNPAAKPDDNAVRRVIEEELLGSSREERDIWYDELKSIPAGVVRDLLQVRKQLRSLPRALHKSDAPPPPMRVAIRATEVSAEPASQSRRLPFPDWAPTVSALEQAASVARHNVANSITPGFKRLRWSLVDAYGSNPEFGSGGEAVTEEEQAAGESARTQQLGPVQVEGCRLAAPLLDHRPGSLLRTGRSLDLAIDGDGFFVVNWNEQPACTRCGAIVLDDRRRLSLSVVEGSAVLQPAITIPEDAQEIQITARGEVLVLRTAGADPEPVGRLQLARFACPERLRPVGATLLVATDASGRADIAEPEAEGRGAIQQGCLEQSNVELETELADIERLQSLLKSLPVQSRPVTAGGATPASR